MEEGAKVGSVMIGSGDDLIAKVGVAFAEILHIDDSNKDVSDGALTSNLCASNVDDMTPPDTNRELQYTSSKIQPNLDCSLKVAQAGRTSEMPANVDCAHSLPMVSPRLVSAMKTAHQGGGTPQRPKLSVSWAPDVYDPPVTSVCHTAKSNNQHRYSRNSRRKDQYHKHKHKKTKHLRGSSSEKKNHAGQRNFGKDDLLHQHQRLSVHARTLPMDILDQSTAVDVMDFSVTTGQESKCGSRSFIRTSLEKLHYSVAEA